MVMVHPFMARVKENKRRGRAKQLAGLGPARLLYGMHIDLYLEGVTMNEVHTGC